MRAIWHAESAEKVARRAHVSLFTKNWAHHEKWTWKIIETFKNDLWPRSQLLFRWGLQSTAPATKNEPEASEVLCLPQKRQFHKTRISTLSECRQSSPNTAACPEKWPPKPPLILPTPANVLRPCRSATPATRMKKCPMPCTRHAKWRLDF